MRCSPQKTQPELIPQVSTPVCASSSHSRPRGRRERRAATTADRMRVAKRKRAAAKLSGGRSRRPSLINIQVEPQMQQSSKKTTRTFIQFSIRESAAKGKREGGQLLLEKI